MSEEGKKKTKNPWGRVGQEVRGKSCSSQGPACVCVCVCVEGGQRGPGRGPRTVVAAAAAEARCYCDIGVQRDLQVQNVIDHMLQDFHLANVLVLRDAGHQLLQLGVAVVHVVQQAQRVVHGGLAPRDSQSVL